MPRRILIIGNSDGIGAAVTKILVEQGDRVVGISRSRSPLAGQNLRHEIQDVASPQYRGVVRQLIAEEGGFDACIYCAGIGSALKLPDLSNEAHVFDVNLNAMVETMEVLVPHWIENSNGHFIGLSSLADGIYNADAPSYSASKAGFSSYLLSMALKLRGTGIAVTNIRFGFVDTKMAKSPTKPLMITPIAAARHVVKCLDRRPMQLSIPKLAAAATWAIGCLQLLRVWVA
jgi:short-subunit dehydrogenase